MRRPTDAISLEVDAYLERLNVGSAQPCGRAPLFRRAWCRLRYWLRRRADPAEPPSLDRFEQSIRLLLDDGEAPSAPPPIGTLAYSGVYRAITPADRRTVLTGLFAAELEYRSQRSLTTDQHSELGKAFKRTGEALLRTRLPRHAGFAYERARREYLKANDVDASADCRFGYAHAARRACPRRLKRIWPTTLWITVGYGYRPWRLLPWLGLLLLTLSTAYAHVARKPLVTASHAVLVNFINPSAEGHLSGPDAILAVTGYLGVLATSVFFALLVKHWFPR